MSTSTRDAVATNGNERPVVHIGAPKTGSTWLQTALFPTVIGRAYGGAGGFEKNRLLSAAILSVSDIAGFSADAVRLVLNSTPSPLLSWEGLSSSNNPIFPPTPPIDEMAERLASVLPEAHVVMMSRKPSAWRRSSYSTYLRNGGCLNFNRYCDLIEDSGADDWSRIADTYRVYFSSVTVVRYEDISENLEHGARAVFGSLGVLFGDSRQGHPNRSMTKWEIRAVRYLNQHSRSSRCESPKRLIKGAGALAGLLSRRQ